MFSSILTLVAHLSAALFLLVVAVGCASILVLPAFSILSPAVPDMVLTALGSVVFLVMSVRVMLPVISELS